MASRSLGHRAPVLWLAGPMMAGLVLGKILAPILPDPSLKWIIGGALLMAFAAIVAAWKRWPWAWAAALAPAMVLIGIAIFRLNDPRLKTWDDLPPREVRVSVCIDRLFPKKDPRKFAGLATIVHADAPVADLENQRIYFSFTQHRATAPLVRGAVVEATGVLAALPQAPATTSFDGYLVDAGIHFRLTRGSILAEEKPAPPYRRFCARTLGHFSALLGVGVESKRPELVGVLRAMLLGQQHELTEDQVSRFRQSGTMHVFSISGLHIAVIAAAIDALLALGRIPRAARLIVGLTSLWLYVDITGTAPSAVRAFVMVAFVQVSLALKAPRNPVSSLAVSALCVLLATPLDFFSASFQMSYGIVAALLLLGLPMADRWQENAALFRDLPKATWAWHHVARDACWRTLLGAAAIGLASSLVSAVTGAQFFNLFTPGALLANAWLIPASTLTILCGLVSLLSGLAGFTAGCALANHAAVLVLWVIDRGIGWNLKIPGMWVTAALRTPGLGGMALAGLLAIIFAGYASGWRGWARGFWPPFAVVALLLVFGVKYG